jgi:hypothetical protein
MNFRFRFRNKVQKSNFIKICAVGAKLFHADRWMDRQHFSLLTVFLMCLKGLNLIMEGKISAPARNQTLVMQPTPSYVAESFIPSHRTHYMFSVVNPVRQPLSDTNGDILCMHALIIQILIINKNCEEHTVIPLFTSGDSSTGW